MILVKPGDIYTCKARRGWTRVKVTSLRDAHTHAPWVIVHRIDEDGKRLRGRFTTGPLENCLRGESFYVHLTNGGDGTNRMRMPNGYSKVSTK